MKLTTAIAFGAAAILSMPVDASAQIPEVTPDGALSDPAAPPPSADPVGPADPVIIPIGPDGRPVANPEAEDSGFYYNDSGSRPSIGNNLGNNQSLYIGGPVPSTHVVRSGDTLWDITWFYFNNPFNWPKVWSYNPEISNPHWIYPGDQVRLYPEGDEPRVATSSEPLGNGSGNSTALKRPPATQGSFQLRQVAFVDQEDLKFAASIDGSTDEKLMLSLGDSVYLSYPDGKPPKVGKRYAIYRPRKDIKHPTSGDRVGAYVKVIGELEVVNVKKGKRARAIITDSTDVIERGAQVGPLQRQFRNIEPSPNEVDAAGTIVAQLFADQLIGARQVVVIDLGEDQKVKEGNRLFVVRRGDAYEDLGGKVDNTGQDDRRFPARAIGEVVIVQVGKTSSLCLVTLVLQEVGVGDQVLMRKASETVDDAEE